MPTEGPDDARLIEQLKRRDAVALETPMAQYETKVFGLVLRVTGNRQDAEEAFQDVFFTIFQKIDRFRGDAKLSSWIYRIAMNAALMKLRKRPKVMVLPLEDELGPGMTEEGMIAEPVVDWSRLPDDEAARRELAQRIEGRAVNSCLVLGGKVENGAILRPKGFRKITVVRMANV